MQNTLRDTAEDCYIHLGETATAFDVLMEELAERGRRRGRENEVLGAVCFVNAFSQYYSAYQVILRDLRHQVSKLQAAVEAEYEANRKKPEGGENGQGQVSGNAGLDAGGVRGAESGHSGSGRSGGGGA